MNYEKLKETLIHFFNTHPDAMWSIEDLVDDVILLVKENEN